MHGENLQLIFPISLVKNEERVIVAVATADNVDKSGDVVDFEASMTAFKNWQGNIRGTLDLFYLVNLYLYIKEGAF